MDQRGIEPQPQGFSIYGSTIQCARMSIGCCQLVKNQQYHRQSSGQCRYQTASLLIFMFHHRRNSPIFTFWDNFIKHRNSTLSDPL